MGARYGGGCRIHKNLVIQGTIRPPLDYNNSFKASSRDIIEVSYAYSKLGIKGEIIAGV